jgi:hypothetical protein
MRQAQSDTLGRLLSSTAGLRNTVRAASLPTRLCTLLAGGCHPVMLPALHPHQTRNRAALHLFSSSLLTRGRRLVCFLHHAERPAGGAGQGPVRNLGKELQLQLHRGRGQRVPAGFQGQPGGDPHFQLQPQPDQRHILVLWERLCPPFAQPVCGKCAQQTVRGPFQGTHTHTHTHKLHSLPRHIPTMVYEPSPPAPPHLLLLRPSFLVDDTFNSSSSSGNISDIIGNLTRRSLLQGESVPNTKNWVLERMVTPVTNQGWSCGEVGAVGGNECSHPSPADSLTP